MVGCEATAGGSARPGASPITVAALFVDPKGVYSTLPGVEIWDKERDARTYPGPWPVVAHPPCGPWSVLAGLVQARTGKPKHRDDGEVEAALAAVRRWGGVMEHPKGSAAWKRYGLLKPRSHVWTTAGPCGGWVAEVAQRHYGHRARKLTWLYAHPGEGRPAGDLPALPEGDGPPPAAAVDSGAFNARRRRAGGAVQARCGKRERAATPAPFAAVLVGLARSARSIDLPPLPAGDGPVAEVAIGVKPETRARFRRMPDRERRLTPGAFAELLVSVARSAGGGGLMPEWRVSQPDGAAAGVFLVEVDTGGGFRPAAAAEVGAERPAGTVEPGGGAGGPAEGRSTGAAPAAAHNPAAVPPSADRLEPGPGNRGLLQREGRAPA